MQATHTPDKFQGPAISVGDSITNSAHIRGIETSCVCTEEHGEFHAHEAAGCHQEGGGSQVGCVGFASKRNEAKRDPFRMRFARSREKKLFFFRFISLRIFRF
jgi:hypothetical protein